ncbi:hypothetical protein Tco_1263337 [Tanacetum coccineum]
MTSVIHNSKLTYKVCQSSSLYRTHPPRPTVKLKSLSRPLKLAIMAVPMNITYFKSSYTDAGKTVSLISADNQKYMILGVLLARNVNTAVPQFLDTARSVIKLLSYAVNGLRGDSVCQGVCRLRDKVEQREGSIVQNQRRHTRRQGKDDMKIHLKGHMLCYDGVGFDWSDMAERTIQEEQPSHPHIERMRFFLVKEVSQLNDSKENSDDSLVKEQVSKDTSSFVESSLNVDKETIFLVDKKMFVKPKNHEKPVKKSVRTHHNAQRNMVVRAVLMKIGLKPFNTARTVNIVHPKSIAKAVNTARPKVVNTVRPHSAVVNAVRVNQENAGKPQQDDTGFINSGCSRHMTGNIAYLSDFKEFDGAEILKKFNYTDVKSASTLVDLEKPLVKDGDADDVDVHLYRSMIRYLMYLTASRPDIMFAVCACARFQVTPKISHLLTIKRIFRYLKGKPTLGLWYSRDSPFELVAYTDSDYAGATQDRKSTTRDLLTKGFDAGSFTSKVLFEGRLLMSICSQAWMKAHVGDEAVHKELGDRMEKAATTASSLEAEQDGATAANLNTAGWQIKTITEASLRRHLKLEDADGISSLPNSKIFEQLALMGYASDSNKLTFQKGLIQQGEGLTVPVESYHIPITTPSTSQPPLSSPSRVPTPPYDSPLLRDLKQTKKVYSNAYTKLIMRVKKLEHKVKSRQPRRRARVVISDTEEDLEDPSKHGRRIAEIDQNPFISLVQDEGTSWIQEDAEIQRRTISTASATLKVSTAAKNLVYIRRSAEKRKDKGKAIMKEDEFVQKKTKNKLEQERLGQEEAIRLQEQINEEERQRIARDAEIAKQLQEEFDRARQEQEVVAEADQAHDIDWSDPTVLRYHAVQNRSFSKAEVRKNMCIYLKNQEGYKQSHFKGMRYEDIRPIFESVWDQNQSFMPMDFELEVQRLKREGQDVVEEPAKRQRTREASGSVQEQTCEEPKAEELSQEQLH